MPAEKCINQNHTKMNVLIRFCPNCGDVVNKKIARIKCNNENHAKSRKDGSQFCSDCGVDLKAT